MENKLVDYRIDEDGTIYSPKGKLVKQTIISGYHYVRIYNIRKAVHRIVAQKFIPNPENKPEVNHKDGNKSNNNAYNLEWSTRLENIHHAWENGLSNSHHLKKVTQEQAEEIRQLHGKLPHRVIGEQYGIARQTVDYIIRKINYK